MITTTLKTKLEKLEDAFAAIGEIYNGFTNEEVEFLNDFHSSDSSIPHIVRWGSQNVSEILNEKVVSPEMTLEVSSEMEVLLNGFDFVVLPVGSKIKVTGISNFLLYNQESDESVIDFVVLESSLTFEEGAVFSVSSSELEQNTF